MLSSLFVVRVALLWVFFLNTSHGGPLIPSSTSTPTTGNSLLSVPVTTSNTTFSSSTPSAASVSSAGTFAVSSEISPLIPSSTSTPTTGKSLLSSLSVPVTTSNTTFSSSTPSAASVSSAVTFAVSSEINTTSMLGETTTPASDDRRSLPWQEISFGLFGLIFVCFVTITAVSVSLCKVKRRLKHCNTTLYPITPSADDNDYMDPKNRAKKGKAVELTKITSNDHVEEVESPAFSPPPPPSVPPPTGRRTSAGAPELPSRLNKRPAPKAAPGSVGVQVKDNKARSQSGGSNQTDETGFVNKAFVSEAKQQQTIPVSLNIPLDESGLYDNGDDNDEDDDTYERYGNIKRGNSQIRKGIFDTENRDIELEDMDAYEEPVNTPSPKSRSATEEYIQRQESMSGLPDNGPQKSLGHHPSGPLQNTSDDFYSNERLCDSGLPGMDCSGLPGLEMEGLDTIENLEAYDEVDFMVQSKPLIEPSTKVPQLLINDEINEDEPSHRRDTLTEDFDNGNNSGDGLGDSNLLTGRRPVFEGERSFPSPSRNWFSAEENMNNTRPVEIPSENEEEFGTSYENYDIEQELQLIQKEVRPYVQEDLGETKEAIDINQKDVIETTDPKQGSYCETLLDLDSPPLPIGPPPPLPVVPLRRDLQPSTAFGTLDDGSNGIHGQNTSGMINLNPRDSYFLFKDDRTVIMKEHDDSYTANDSVHLNVDLSSLGEIPEKFGSLNVAMTLNAEGTNAVSDEHLSATGAGVKTNGAVDFPFSESPMDKSVLQTGDEFEQIYDTPK